MDLMFPISLAVSQKYSFLVRRDALEESEGVADPVWLVSGEGWWVDGRVDLDYFLKNGALSLQGCPWQVLIVRNDGEDGVT